MTVAAYGIGAMFLTPLQELHLLGRNPVYMVTLFLFVIFQIPTITAKNINTVLAMRFMTGLSGSPALATGVGLQNTQAVRGLTLVFSGCINGRHLPL
jgi:predicted MFS family arabinose efflux permease